MDVGGVYQLGLVELRDVLEFFASIYSNVRYEGRLEGKMDLSSISEFLSKNEDVFTFVKKFIAECDAGVSGIFLHQSETPEKVKEFTPMFIHTAVLEANSFSDS